MERNRTEDIPQIVVDGDVVVGYEVQSYFVEYGWVRQTRFTFDMYDKVLSGRRCADRALDAAMTYVRLEAAATSRYYRVRHLTQDD